MTLNQAITLGAWVFVLGLEWVHKRSEFITHGWVRHWIPGSKKGGPLFRHGTSFTLSLSTWLQEIDRRVEPYRFLKFSEKGLAGSFSLGRESSAEGKAPSSKVASRKYAFTVGCLQKYRRMTPGMNQA